MMQPQPQQATGMSAIPWFIWLAVGFAACKLFDMVRALNLVLRTYSMQVFFA
jgi:hypothetical protein